MERNEILNEIENLLKKFYETREENFVPGQTKIRYASAVYNDEEVMAVINSLLGGWLGLGESGSLFEKELAKRLNVKEAILTNSGSSSNLLAVASLVSNNFKNRLKRGEEVILPAMAFPTTINPSLQYGLNPVFIDTDIETYNVNLEELEKAVTEKTKLIMFPHTLGNPVDMKVVMDIANEHGIHVVEDCCDALGSKFDGKNAGTFGTFGTFSFYAAHHISMGEGGAVVSNDSESISITRSLRDWGRITWCPQCQKPLDTTYCPHRFVQLENNLPSDYDRRFIYTEIGYNLKPLELQAAMGLIQLKKLEVFNKTRTRNFKMLYEGLEKYENYFILPEVSEKSDPQWFAFPLTIKDGVPFKRHDIVSWLEKSNIETRPMFIGNVVNQPAYKNIDFRIVGELKNTQKVMRDSFFFGLHHGLSEKEINFILETFGEFIKRNG